MLAGLFYCFYGRIEKLIQRKNRSNLKALIMAYLTCWFIRRIAMSFRSFVKRSNAASMAEFSVLASTTRKFFCESGGCVTC